MRKKRKTSFENFTIAIDEIIEESNNQNCFVCDQYAPITSMRCIQSLDVVSKIKDCAEDINNDVLLKKCEDFKLEVAKVYYHVNCLTNLYNSRKNFERSKIYKFENLTILHSSVL